MTTRPIDSIRVRNRFRRDMGDIDSLAASIADVGLLHPVVIRSNGTLIAGERRLAACRQIGLTKVPVTVIDLAQIVRGEYAENAERKDFTLSEAVAIKRAVEPEIKAKAQARMRAGKAGANLAQGPNGKARDQVARFVGKKRTTLDKAAAVVDAAEAEPEKYGKLVEAMDRTGRANGPFKRLTIARQAEAIRREPPPLPGRGPYRVPKAGPRLAPWKAISRAHVPAPMRLNAPAVPQQPKRIREAVQRVPEAAP